MSSAKTHLQVHNIWPITYASLISIATLIFTAGSLHARFTSLEKDFNDYKRENNENIWELRRAVGSVAQKEGEKLIVLDRSGNVQGVATRESSLKVTPSPTKKPTPTPTVEVSPTP